MKRRLHLPAGRGVLCGNRCVSLPRVLSSGDVRGLPLNIARRAEWDSGAPASRFGSRRYFLVLRREKDRQHGRRDRWVDSITDALPAFYDPKYRRAMTIYGLGCAAFPWASTSTASKMKRC